MKESDYESCWREARNYNERLSEEPLLHYPRTEGEIREYRDLLNLWGNGIMADFEIPKLHRSIPIYHGVGAGTLTMGITHIPGTSLPIGGPGTHCVLCENQGIKPGKRFSGFQSLEEGDIFLIRVLGRKITYRIDRRYAVLGDPIGALEIERGKDFCTLIAGASLNGKRSRMIMRAQRTEPMPEWIEPYEVCFSHLFDNLLVRENIPAAIRALQFRHPVLST